MKKLFLATAMALALSAGATLAADVHAVVVPPPPPPPPPPMWTGFYAGLNAGYSWGASNNVDVVSATLFDGFGAFDQRWVYYDPFFSNVGLAGTGVANVNRSGFIGGAQAGYNYQFSNSFLVGVEADIQGAGIRGENSFIAGSAWTPYLDNWFEFDRAAIGATTITAHTDWLGTLRGRVGYLYTPTFLIYATGGLAYGGARSATYQAHFVSNNFTWWDHWGTTSLSLPFASTGGVGRYDQTRVGWTVGGGLEWMFAPNLSLKAEYLYYDLGTAHYLNSPLVGVGPNVSFCDCTTPPLVTASQSITRVRFDGHIARIGFNYHFFTPVAAPAVVAKY
jgi:outer membrane immunogenic protein